MSRATNRTSQYDPSTERTVAIDPDSAAFVVVSFEGPDPYSQAGGLGVRITGLTEALADLEYDTHLFFIGDPASAPEESARDGKLRLHRWAQWISANCPRGVYDGEESKMHDLTRSLPPHVIERVILPIVATGRIPVVLFEEWQTAECACRVAESLEALRLRDRALIAWNANHCYGFDRIDWPRLSRAATITTVSRHMRSIVRAHGVDARVIPNGIPSAALAPVAKLDVAHVRSAVAERPHAGLFFKMARWEREKGWLQALDAVARMRDTERPAVLVARSGGPSGKGGELQRDAAQRDLSVVSFDTEAAFMSGFAESMKAGADVVNLRFGVSSAFARTLFAASDGVLANSVSEPFGLVGLEAMAAGGVAYTGGTGEDYAVSGRNAVVLETLDPGEIVHRWDELSSSPETASRLRRSARKTARDYEWCSVVPRLIGAID